MIPSRLPVLAAAGALALCAATPAAAQVDPLVEIDRTINASQGVAPAMRLARSQIAEEDLVGALATLERLLVDNPQANEALLLHAALLCRLDDGAGARAEISALQPVVGNSAWVEVRAACGPLPQAGGDR